MKPDTCRPGSRARLLVCLGSLLWAPLLHADPATPDRVRLLRIQPGFLSGPLRLVETDEEAPTQSGEDIESEWIRFGMGSDNPFFDLRKPGDPGGVGFTRVNTQVQLLDTERTAFSLGFQAVTPAGLQFDGLPDHRGPTVVTPALSLFHDLGTGTAVQAFVEKNLPVSNRATQPVSLDLQYGLAVQHPLASGLFFSVGALGQVRMERETTRSATGWEVLPGLTWQLADTWWIAGGLVVPLGVSTQESVLPWQVTCQWQF